MYDLRSAIESILSAAGLLLAVGAIDPSLAPGAAPPLFLGLVGLTYVGRRRSRRACVSAPSTSRPAAATS